MVGRRTGWVALSLLWASTAGAQQLDITVDEAAAAALGIDVAALEQQLNAEAASAFNLADPVTFMESMANATSVSSKGMGVDYASHFDAFVLGGSLGSSVHSSGFRFGRSDEALPPGGFAVMVSGMAGLNLGLLDGGKDTFLDRVRIYGNGMAFELPSDREFGGKMYNVGAHLQVTLVPQVGKDAAGWGGLDLTTGWERAQYSLILERDIPLTAPVDEAELTWDAAGSYEIVATSDSIPVELSTSVSLVLLSIYAGGGVDIHTSSADSTAALSGPITAKVRAQEESIGSAALTASFAGDGDPFVPRAFVGAQANLSLFKIYGHLNAGLNGTVGGHVGARVAM